MRSFIRLVRVCVSVALPPPPPLYRLSRRPHLVRYSFFCENITSNYSGWSQYHMRTCGSHTKRIWIIKTAYAACWLFGK